MTTQAPNAHDIQRTQAQLRMSQLITENIPIGLHLYHLENVADDRSLRLVYANPAVKTLTGLGPEDIVGKTLDENFPGLRAKGFPQRYADVVRHQAAISIEDISYGDDRIPMASFAIRAFPLPGNHVGVAFENITEGKLAKAAAIQSRRLLDAAQQLAHIGGWEWDNERQTMMWTDETYRIHGLRAHEFPAGSPTHIAHSIACYDPADRPIIETAFLRCAEEGIPYDLELPLTRADHQRIWIRTVAKAVKDNDRVVKVIGTIADITANKRVEAALRESEERFRSYFELGLIGMAITSIDKGWLEVNDRLCGILGYPREELITRTWAELTHPDDLAADVAQFERVLNKEIEGYSLDKRFIAKDGRTIWAAISAKCLRKPDGSIDHFVAMVLDITERITAEREHRAAADRLAALSRNLVAVQENTRRRLAQELHERTSPNLAAIAINLDTADQALNERNWALAAERIADNRGLLEDTAIGVREICADLRPPALDYAGLVAAVETYVSQFSRRTGIAVAFEYSREAIRPTAEVESMLFRIVQEALTNVAKHALASRASVHLAIDNAATVLVVSDDGCGFALDQPAGHAGLGLITMREMAEFVGGSYLLESSPGEGTRIRVAIARGDGQVRERRQHPRQDSR